METVGGLHCNGEVMGVAFIVCHRALYAKFHGALYISEYLAGTVHSCKVPNGCLFFHV